MQGHTVRRCLHAFEFKQKRVRTTKSSFVTLSLPVPLLVSAPTTVDGTEFDPESGLDRIGPLFLLQAVQRTCHFQKIEKRFYFVYDYFVRTAFKAPMAGVVEGGGLGDRKSVV